MNIENNDNGAELKGFGDEANHGKGHPSSEDNVSSPSPKSRMTLRQLIESGSKVTQWIKLPEWNGFWVKVFDDVYVFTKDNEILNTPQIDVYGDRDDYEFVELDHPSSFDLKIRFIKMNRARLDRLLITAERLLPKNRETALVKTSIQLAIMWLGKFLADLGDESPYPKSLDPKDATIEPLADTSAKNPQIILFNSLEDLDATAIIKTLRVEIKHSLQLFASFGYIPPRGNDIWVYPSEMAVKKSLQEANMWLGMELNNIRIEEAKPNELPTSPGPQPSQPVGAALSQGVTDEEKLLFEAIESYRKYGEFTDFKNFMNQPMPKWEELPEKIKGAWKNAIRRFVK